MIETDYKPDGALGALYSGFNAANADQSAQLELIKQALANQREQQIQPYDVNIKSAESARADMQKLPEMLDAYKRLYMGQADSTQAAGSKAINTWQNEAELANRENRNKITQQDWESRLNTLKQASIDAAQNGGSIGFPMQNSQTTAQQWMGEEPVGKFTGDPLQIFNKIKTIRDPQDRATAIRAFQNQYGQDTVQQMNANNSPIVEQPPLRNGGVNQGSPEYEALMKAMYDTPKLRQDMMKSDQKLDSAEYIVTQKLEAEMEKAKLRGSVGQKDPKTAQETMQRILAKKQRGEKLTQEDLDVYQTAAETLNSITAAKVQQGVTLDPTEGTIVPKSPQVTAPTAPVGNAKPQLPTGWAIK